MPSQPDEPFRLTDVSALLPRRPLARPGLAEQAVEGLLRADSYRPLTAFQVVVASAEVRDAPDGDRISEIVFGEGFDVLESRGPRAWGRARRDGTIGWIDRSALGPVAAPDARIAMPRTPAHRSASAEAEASVILPWNALVRTGNRREGFIEVLGAGWVAEDAVAPFGLFEPDMATAAERLLGTPHVPGGRSDRGTDCSGLVQQALTACGLPGARYTPDQAELGRPVTASEARRGDLILWHKPDLKVWGGHSAIVYDADHVIHATGDAGAVVIEPTDAAAMRCSADSFDPPICLRL